ncbi:hypothetical protein THAOC_35674, partial [Thalassiosira oceanica]
MSISPPITRASAAIILAVLAVLVALVQNLPTAAAAVTIRPPTTSFTVAMPTDAGRRLWHGRISQNVADEAFSGLQEIYDGTGRSTGKKEQPRATKLGARSFDRDIADGGILLLDNDDKASILASMNTAEGRANLTPIQKFHDIISYQFEFGYDLAIAPELNVSRSPGFESVLGIFGGSSRLSHREGHFDRDAREGTPLLASMASINLYQDQLARNQAGATIVQYGKKEPQPSKSARKTNTMMMKPSLALAPLFLFLEPSPAGRGACAFVTRSVSLTRKAAVKVSYSNSDDNADGESKSLAATPSFIETPLLLLLYPSLVSHKKEFGNPNIPLGSPDGKRCATVRRLHFQGKLSAEEVDHLQEMGFRFNSFEDVYTKRF